MTPGLQSSCCWVRENQRENDTDRYELSACSILASRRGGRTSSPGSKPIDQTADPTRSPNEALSWIVPT
jgi:hypothetical protein